MTDAASVIAYFVKKEGKDTPEKLKIKPNKHKEKKWI